MSRTHPVRRSTRWPARWPMLYGNEQFVAKGTVLHVTANGWRVEGPMPVHPGMRLSLWVWPPERPKGLHVEGATVLWVKGFEFGVDVQNMDPIDHAWLTQFLDQAFGLWVVPRQCSVVRTAASTGAHGGATEGRSVGPVADESGPDISRKRVFPFLGAGRQRAA